MEMDDVQIQEKDDVEKSLNRKSSFPMKAAESIP